MVFYINDQRFRYELEKLSRLFLPFEKFKFTDDLTDVSTAEDYIKLSVDSVLCVEVKYDGRLEAVEKTKLSEDYEWLELNLALMLFDCFEKLTGYRSPWGILTGIRPAKLLGRLIEKDGESKALDYFQSTLLVTPEKTALCKACHTSERSIIEQSKPRSFSLYISVPFCPSRCSYCSFVSHSVEQAKSKIPQYVNLLCEEIRLTAKIVRELDLKLLTVYIGGGTPTTLSAEQLTEVMSVISKNFDLTGVLEYTVEAGRPDTVTREKLIAIQQGGATRISINPQTMNDEVLKAIGRRHTVAETVEAFKLARECGFDNINTDLIAGLSGDTLESFKHSVDEIIKLDPENVTVHTLSMKRASNLTKSGTVFDTKQSNSVSQMVDYALERLEAAGIKPYYMYRQSKTAGNLENVGYAKSGCEGLYNVYIMDETHTILACGASAVTKLREPNGDFIDRIFNFKYPYEYIERFQTIVDRKEGIREFYKKYPVGDIAKA